MKFKKKNGFNEKTYELLLGFVETKEKDVRTKTPHRAYGYSVSVKFTDFAIYYVS